MLKFSRSSAFVKAFHRKYSCFIAAQLRITFINMFVHSYDYRTYREFAIMYRYLETDSFIDSYVMAMQFYAYVRSYGDEGAVHIKLKSTTSMSVAVVDQVQRT